MTNPGDHLSDSELSALTGAMEDLHRDQTMPAMNEAVSEWSAALGEAEAARSRKRTSRRTFLLGAAGVTAGGVMLAAFGPARSSSATPAAAAAELDAKNKAKLTGDLAVAAMAASLENLAVFAYNAGLQAAAAGKLGSVPPAVATFAKTAMMQHKDHARAWNSVLTGAHKPAVTATDPALTPTVQMKFAQVTNVTGLAELALLLENVAAQTYQNGVGVLSSPQAVAVAATIQPVEMQHAAILYFVLGQYPGIQGDASTSFASGTPLAFNPTTLARPASDYTHA